MIENIPVCDRMFYEISYRGTPATDEGYVIVVKNKNNEKDYVEYSPTEFIDIVSKMLGFDVDW